MIGKMFALVIVGALFVAGLTIYGKIAPNGVSNPPPTVLPTSVAAARPSVVTAAQPTVAGKTVQVEMSEQEVTLLLRERLRELGYQVDDLSVRLEDGRFVVTSTQKVAFFSVLVTIVGEASIVDGQLSIRPISVNASGAPVPQDLVDQLTNTFRNELSSSIDALPVKPVGLQLKPGKLIVQGQAR